LEDTVGKFTIADAGIDFFVSLICYTVSVIVALCFPEFLPKFGKARFTRSSGLFDPLVTVERFRLNKRRRPKQHRDNQCISHVLISGGYRLLNNRVYIGDAVHNVRHRASPLSNAVIERMREPGAGLFIRIRLPDDGR
jgi:hypothetical protein